MNEFSINVTVQGIAELTAAISRLAGQGAGGVPQAGNMGMPVQAPPVQPAAGMAAQQMPSQVPAQPPVQAAPAVQQPQAAPAVQAPQMTAVPSGVPVQGYALEQLQVAAAGLMSAGKGQQVMGILQRFGIQAMTELPRERYGEFAMALREAGAQL